MPGGGWMLDLADFVLVTQRNSRRRTSPNTIHARCRQDYRVHTRSENIGRPARVLSSIGSRIREAARVGDLPKGTANPRHRPARRAPTHLLWANDNARHTQGSAIHNKPPHRSKRLRRLA